VGNPNAEAEIPGGIEPVKSRLQEKPLEAIARATDGAYIPMHTRDYPLGEFLSRFTTGERLEHGEDALPAYRQRYAWFLAPALACLALSMLLGEGRRRMYP
jgi:hypothetical protein